MKQNTKLAIYFLGCIFLLSIAPNFKSAVMTVIYYLFVFINMGYAIRLVTIYDQNRHENK